MMERLTKDDVKEMGMLELSHNQVFVKNREAWYRDYDMEITARDLAQAMFARNGIECPAENDEFDVYMLELLQDGYETLDGMIALYYNALWAFAEVREKLKAYEDTDMIPEDIKNMEKNYIELQHKYQQVVIQLERHADLVEQKRLIIAPCRVGQDVWWVQKTIRDKKIIECICIGWEWTGGNIYMKCMDKETGHILSFFDFHFKDKNGLSSVFTDKEEAEKALEVKNEN